jgi:aromatic-L-amino-acid decarboxylase
MLDDMLDYLQDIRERPVWQPIPQDVRSLFRERMPQKATDLRAVHETFMRSILPFSVGNAHPGFMRWMHGGGATAGMLEEMLAPGLNANLGGRDQIPLEVERQVSEWIRTLFEFPDSATGLFVTGTSMANLISVLVARTAAMGTGVRKQGIDGHRLVGYASIAAHESVAKAFDISGLGTNALRRIPVNAQYQIDTSALAEAIDADRDAGLVPFLIVGTAGTVDVGAIDDLDHLADIAKSRRLWLHVDGAFGALAMLAPEIAPLLRGITRADSIAFDFHKWGQVPYDAGFVLVRDGIMHRNAFASAAPYLTTTMPGIPLQHLPLRLT